MGGTFDWQNHISVDPEVCHGKPCFRGTRIMVTTVLEFLEDRASFARIKAGYPSLTQKHIRAALAFARSTLESGHYIVLGKARHEISH